LPSKKLAAERALRECDGAALFGKPITLVKDKNATPATSVAVTFCELVTTTYGQTIYIRGRGGMLENWNKWIALSPIDYTSSHPLWFITIEFVAGAFFEYKYFKVAADGTEAWGRLLQFSVPGTEPGTEPETQDYKHMRSVIVLVRLDLWTNLRES
jgi:Starch binding domain